MLAPRSEDDLAQILRDSDLPLAIRGGGSRGVTVPGAALTTSGLTGIRLYEPGALTMVAAAGTPLAEIAAQLAAEGQRLPFDPPDLRALLGGAGKPTIGGVFASNASGPARVAVGAARDFLLGVRFVDGQGALVKNGGRVMKNVTGLDLVKLMAGAHGTLGVLTEVSFKVLPRPASVATLVIAGQDLRQAVAAMAVALGSPFDVTGAAHLQGETLIRVEGTALSVAYRAGRLAGLLARFGTVSERAVDWGAIRDCRDWADQPGDVWRLSVKPSDAPDLVARMAGNTSGAEARLDWGGGLVWLRVAAGTDLRAALGRFHGHATRIRGTGGGPRFQPEAPGVAQLTAGLRARFDPRGILNRGLMG